MLLFLVLIRSVIGAEEMRIANYVDFYVFVSNVSNGINYTGTTVYLDSDISLLETIVPIGDYYNYFLGVFDGQGHIISDLKMNSPSEYTGLFGNSDGLTIRNVVLDDSCSITSTFSDSNSGWGYVGGIIGLCGECIIENSVNMADVTFSGSVSHELYIGGIVGCFYYTSSSYNTHVKNCVNYGSVTDSGTVNGWAELGGIVGLSYESSPCIYIQNCLNYGTIIHNGTIANLTVGGIVGNGRSYTYIENCVSAGKIVKNQESRYIGTFVGLIGSEVHINYCYYTSDVSVNGIYGYAVHSPIITGTPNTPTNANSDLVNKLNIISTSYNWSKWFMLQLNGGKINNLKQEFLVEIQRHIPNPVKEGCTFIGWFTEDNKNVSNETTINITANTTLHAHWEEISEVKKEKNSISIFFIVGIIAAVIIIVTIVILAVILRKKEHNNRRRYENVPNDDSYVKVSDVENVELNNQQREEYCRIVTIKMDENETKIASENSQGILTNLYPQGYERPSMRDALLEASLTEEQTDYIYNACEIASQRVSEEGRLFDGFTEDDAAAIAMYTYDFGPGNFERNPYRIINKSLVGRNYNNLQKASGLLYLVMAALRKLPRYTGKTLYRGVKGEVNLSKGHYHKGNIITWSALSSTSPDIDATKAFLAKGSKSKKVEGTLFIIDYGWGYDIQPYSLFPDEVEILLEPDRQFKVTGVVEAKGLTIINLQMLDTPLSISEVFGGK